jgi:CRISPR-associated protein Cas1
VRKLLNTLFITVQGAVLHRENDTIDVCDKTGSLLKMPIHLLSGVVCFGVVTVTPPCMALCAENGVVVTFLTEYGRFLARVSGPVSGNVLLRKAQYKASDDPVLSARIARRIVTAKVANSRTLLQRFCRDHSDSDHAAEVRETVDVLSSVINALRQEEPLDVVRGREGDAARRYFAVFDHLIVTQKNDFQFQGRSRRPPLDPINALLSFLYTMLVHDVTSACETVGLDPAVGYLHRDRPGRPGLALDIMEELRPVLADRLVLSLINRVQVKSGDFHTSEAGAVLLNNDSRKMILAAWQEKKREVIVHPFIEEKVELGQIAFVQALLLSRFLRGDLDDYPAFIWK